MVLQWKICKKIDKVKETYYFFKKWYISILQCKIRLISKGVNRKYYTQIRFKLVANQGRGRSERPRPQYRLGRLFIKHSLK